MNKKTAVFGLPSSVFCSLFFVLYSIFSFSQVTSSIDATSIKIGEQITYKIEVLVDSTSLVVFPEGQTFSPLEVIESYKIDTTKQSDKFNLIKKYGLTQFDSGAYTIPRQKIVVGDKIFFTDSLKVAVNNIIIDTTKQGLYDIKPFIEVEKTQSNWLNTVLIIIFLIGLIAFLIYWFLWRKKPLTEEEKVALLPPYERAKLALKKLEESSYLEHSEFKEYYSELTLAIRKYLDEKVYDHALESTTDELMSRLKLLKDGNQIDLSNETLKNLESIFKRADLVKFAKSTPDKELAKLDKKTIDLEIDHVKEILPEASEEEKLLNQKYKEKQARKKKRKKVIITIAIAVFLVIATFVGFGLKYGFPYVKDTLLRNNSLELLERTWVKSDYGFPPIMISTPQVLKRVKTDSTELNAGQIESTIFSFEELKDNFSIVLNTTKLKETESEEKIDLTVIAEKSIQELEKIGLTNIFVKNEKFVTPNNAEGLKTYGSANFPVSNTDSFIEGEYILLHFTTQNIIQKIVITWRKDDKYAEKIVKKIVDSVELKPDAE